MSLMSSLTFDQDQPGCVRLFLTFRDTLEIGSRYLLRTSDPTLTRNTMLMLPRSMIVVFRISTRTLGTLCRMFPDLLSKHRCMGKIMILRSPLYLSTFELAILSCMSCSAFPWTGYTPNTCV